jgi:tRNA(fMet)-specific endonuclease VapC
MIYLLDTNACIAYLRTPLSALGRRITQQQPGDIALCAVVKSELIYGAAHSARPQEQLTKLEHFFQPYVSLPFDDTSAAIAGRVRADLAARGTPIGAHDLQIAAIALANNLTLVTHNTREFSRVAGLRIEDWERDDSAPSTSHL